MRNWGVSRHRLVPPMRESVLWGWLGPIVVAIFGGVLRFTDLGRPHAVVFDETYYVKDAYALLHYGAERAMLGDSDDPVADKRLIAGDTDIFQKCADYDQCASYVAHPPLGKWMIGAGEWLFGMNPFGWRFAAALVGTLSILMLARVARRMTRSTLLGCFAGLLLALDGLHFVLSRTALLDIFLMFWVLAGFACLVVDRDRTRERLVGWWESTAVTTTTGPRLGPRPWRIAAGACLGAACAVKWSGIFFLVAFAVLSFLWDMGARRALGLRQPYRGALSLDLPPAVAAFAAVPALAYALSWTGWFVTDAGWGRGWEQATSSGPFFFVIDSVRSWLTYHFQVLGYHSGVDDYHPYMSEPWTWPLLFRPVSFHYPTGLPGSACGADACSQAVLGVGTPALWYGSALALLGCVAWYVAGWFGVGRDWRAGAVTLAYAAGWLPWFYYAITQDRTMYLFYMIPVVPFMVLAVTLMAGLLLGSAGTPSPRRAGGAAVMGAFALVVLINFWWLHPVLSAETVTQAEWWDRMLTGSWVSSAPK